MSATTKELFKIKAVSDHDCGNYKVGEIDFLPRNEIEEYVDKHEEFAIKELQDCFHSLVEIAKSHLRKKRNEQAYGASLTPSANSNCNR